MKLLELTSQKDSINKGVNTMGKEGKDDDNNKDDQTKKDEHALWSAEKQAGVNEAPSQAKPEESPSGQGKSEKED